MASLFVVPTGPRRIRLVFSEPALLDEVLLSPDSYTVRDVSGEETGWVFVEEVLPEQEGNPLSVVLVLLSDLRPTAFYEVGHVPEVQTPTSDPFLPYAQSIQWVGSPLRAEAGLARFSGETRAGLLGDHDGLVFFSPALQSPLAGSVIEVEEVSVCTRAYDVYIPPRPPDPPAFFLWAEGTQSPGLGDTVLWGGHGTLSEVSLDLVCTHADTVPPPVDGRCVATLQEPMDITFLSYLNNPYWVLNGDGGVLFICLDNTGPIPPGPTVVIPLVP